VLPFFFLKHDTALERLGNDSGELLQLRLERHFDLMSSLTNGFSLTCTQSILGAGY
jgi:hypothetical protein